MKSITLAKGCASIVRVRSARWHMCVTAWVSSCTVHGRTMFNNTFRSMSVIGDTPFMLIDQLSSAHSTELRWNYNKYVLSIILWLSWVIELSLSPSPPVSLLSIALQTIDSFSNSHTYQRPVHFPFIYAWMCIVQTFCLVFTCTIFGTLNISQLHGN